MVAKCQPVLSNFFEEDSMVAFQRLLPTLASADKPTAYTVGFDANGIFDARPGIEVDSATMLGRAVPLGNDRGRARLIRLDGMTPPALNLGRIFAAGMKQVEKEGKVLHFLVGPRAGEVLVCVQTGHHSVRRLKSPIEHGAVALRGMPYLVDHGMVRSVAGDIVSRESLWRLCEGDAVRVVNIAGAVFDLVVRRGEVLLEEVERIDPAIALRKQQLALSWEQAREGVAYRNRDGGRHGLLNLIDEMSVDEAPSVWEELHEHLRTHGDAPSVGLLNRIVAKCPIRELREWAIAELAKQHGSARVVVAFPSTDRASTSKARPRNDKAARRARDVERHAATRALPRPGERADSYKNKKKGGNKKK